MVGALSVSNRYQAVMTSITRVGGVRSACVVDAVDGLVVAEVSRVGTDPGPLAALAANLTRKLDGALGLAGHGPPRVIHVEAELGHLMLKPVSPEILLVAITDTEANLGLLRLALADAAERLD